MNRPLVELDLECYPDYFLAKFYDERTGRFCSVGKWEGNPLDIPQIVRILQMVTIITFNGVGYDVPMLTLALYGATNAQLKEANDDIIVRGLKPWEFYQKWDIETAGLHRSHRYDGSRTGRPHQPEDVHGPDARSAYAGLADTIRPPRSTPTARFVIADYCGNDLIGTNLLRHEVWDRIQLRMAVGERYGIDVRSKSDAQIAEAVIKSQLDFRPAYRTVNDGYTFNYVPPEYIRYVTPQMQELLQVVRTAPFVVRDKEEAIALGYYDPEDDEQPKIRTGGVLDPRRIARARHHHRQVEVPLGHRRLALDGIVRQL